jgi:hypothetical protein
MSASRLALALACALVMGGAEAKAKAKGKSTIVHGGGRMGADPRHPPPLAPGRKIAEQDCSKAVDLAAGNLRCK